MGRPTEHKPEYNEQVFKLCLLGATDKEIARFFNVEERTIDNWKKDPKKGFFQSMLDGKEKADAEVASKLYSRANGYTWTEHVPIKLKREYIDENGKKLTEERVEIVPIQKTVPPDTQANRFWLMNRKSKKWRDKQEVDVTSKGNAIGYDGIFTDDQLRKALERRRLNRPASSPSDGGGASDGAGPA